MKKKLLIVAMLIMAIICLLTASVSAAEYVDENGIKYKTNSDGTATVADSRETFSGTDAIIKSTITVEGTEYTVTTVASSAFNGESQLTTIYFPPTITTIQGYTFCGCSNLTNVYIDVENLVTLGERGLTTCTNSNGDNGTIKTIKFSPTSEYGKAEPQAIDVANFKNIKTIGAAAAQGFNANALILGENLESFSKQAFRHSSIQSLVMKTTKLTYFNHYTFNACLNLKTIEIYSSPVTIENDYFSQCQSVESIKINLSNCTSVGGSAFEFSTGCQGSGTNTKALWYNLDGERKVDLSNVKELKSEAFGTSNLGSTEIIWPKALDTLDNQVFRKANITGLIYLNASEGKTITLKDYTLNGNNFTTLILGPGITTVEGQFSADCTVVSLADSITFTYTKHPPMTTSSTLYSKNAIVNHSTKPKIVTISSGAVNYSTTCGITADVVTADGIVTIGTSTHNYVEGEYDNTVCPMNTFKTHTCSKCEGTKLVSDVDGLVPTEHEHTIKFSITYVDYTEYGVITYKCVGCESTENEDTASASPLFTYLGFSADKNDSTQFCVGYSIDQNALNDYQAVNTSTEFSYGVVATSTKLTTRPIGTDGNRVSDKVMNASISSMDNAGEISSIDLVVKGDFTNSTNANAQLGMALYVINKNGTEEATVGYVGSEGTTSEIETVTFAEKFPDLAPKAE